MTFILLGARPSFNFKSMPAPFLLKIGNQTLLDLQIQAIQNHHREFDIILCCGEDASEVWAYLDRHYRDFPIRVVQNNNVEENNYGADLKIALNNTTNTKIFISDGFNVLNKSALTSISDDNYTFVNGQSEVGATVEEGKITGLSYGLENSWAEILYLANRHSILKLRKILSDNTMWFEALSELSQNETVLGIYNQEIIVKINKLADYRKLTKETQ